MRAFNHIIAWIALGSNVLCAAGFQYAKTVYSKAFNPQKMHYFSVVLLVNFIFYLAAFLYLSIRSVLDMQVVDASLSIGFVVAPFVIAQTGNDYTKARNRFNIQIVIMCISLCFVTAKLAHIIR